MRSTVSISTCARTCSATLSSAAGARSTRVRATPPVVVVTHLRSLPPLAPSISSTVVALYPSRLRRAPPQRGQETRAQGHQDQNLRAARAEVLDVDRRVHFGGTKHVQKGASYSQLVVVSRMMLTRVGLSLFAALLVRELVRLTDVRDGGRVPRGPGYHPQEERVVRLNFCLYRPMAEWCWPGVGPCRGRTFAFLRFLYWVHHPLHSMITLMTIPFF